MKTLKILASNSNHFKNYGTSKTTNWCALADILNTTFSLIIFWLKQSLHLKIHGGMFFEEIQKGH